MSNKQDRETATFLRQSLLYPLYRRCPICHELTALPDYVEYYSTIKCLECNNEFDNPYKKENKTS